MRSTYSIEKAELPGMIYKLLNKTPDLTCDEIARQLKADPKDVKAALTELSLQGRLTH